MTLISQGFGLADTFGIKADGQEGKPAEQSGKAQREPQERSYGGRDGKQAEQRDDHQADGQRDPLGAPGPRRLGQPAQQRVLHHIDQA